MLVKLMKHEFRATSRVMLPLYLVLLVVSLGANLSVNVLMESDFHILQMMGGLLIAAFTIGIIGVCIMTVALMVQRFQKNLLSDEGYLMFTLPVNVHQQVWSKLLVSAVWFAATFLVVCLAGWLFVYHVGILRDLLKEVGYFIHVTTGYEMGSLMAIFLECVALAFVACCTFCLQFYAAMAVGYSRPNHKALFSVVSFFGFQFAAQTVGIILMNVLVKVIGVLPVDEMLDAIGMQQIYMDGLAATQLMLVVIILGCAVYGAIFYRITTWFLKNRLNLE